MRKIVINTCYGGFGLSDTALQELKIEHWNNYSMSRDDAALVACVERLGAAANGNYAELKIVEIPDDVKWCIQEYDGVEWIAEVHRTWR